MIHKKDLGRLDFIAKGADGSVYALPDLRLPGCPPLAYKEAGQPALREFSLPDWKRVLDAMARAVAFRSGLSPSDRDDLDECTTWPIDMVDDGGLPCGSVMPLLPPDFFVRTNPASGPRKDIPLDLSWLSAKDSQARAAGVDPTAFRDQRIRVVLLAELARALWRLHEHGIVYGDLNLRNVAFALGPPRIKLLDCDATALLTDPTRRQLHSPFFSPPDTAGRWKLQDDRTDVYKLALCVIRGLNPGPGATQHRDPTSLVGKLDPPAIEVVRRAVDVDPLRRPTARELFECLEWNLPANALPPERRPTSTGGGAPSRREAPNPPGNGASGKVFLSYRRADTRHLVGRLADRLVERFGEDRVFCDVDSIAAGEDFAEVVEREVNACTVLLAVIGPGWLDAADGQRRRRLDDGDDLVAFEVRTALARGIRVIPVLVDGASMPPADRLPAGLAPLAGRNAVTMTHESFRSDFHRLATRLAELVD
ncbi:TIR domain-containing protein [Saccharothrix xinjiangensis]|uniref:TIR domain-containing protein n=1 Tax=Saccharothrix xinjiangensis TaxID=204798 RepID=A0ABV9YIM3_9PSEU